MRQAISETRERILKAVAWLLGYRTRKIALYGDLTCACRTTLDDDVYEVQYVVPEASTL